jgi:hypothetical protein
MRLTERELAAIADTAAAVFGPIATVHLYRSRLDDPLDFDRQAGCLNHAYAAIAPLIDTLDEVKDFVARRPDLRAGA